MEDSNLRGRELDIEADEVEEEEEKEDSDDMLGDFNDLEEDK